MRMGYLRSDASLTAETSLMVPALTPTAIFSVIVLRSTWKGISVMMMVFFPLRLSSMLYLPRMVSDPRPVR